MHEGGGRGACPMKEMKPKVASWIAKEAGRRVKIDPEGEASTFMSPPGPNDETFPWVPPDLLSSRC
jgi:hypothetical protein